MAFTQAEIQANRDHFAHKLHAEKQRSEVVHAVESGNYDFVLVDTRGRAPFANGHIPGAVCAPLEELEQAMASLPRDREIVSYCWSHD